jgi:hypothetical protein
MEHEKVDKWYKDFNKTELENSGFEIVPMGELTYLQRDKTRLIYPIVVSLKDNPVYTMTGIQQGNTLALEYGLSFVEKGTLTKEQFIKKHTFWVIIGSIMGGVFCLLLVALGVYLIYKTFSGKA